MDREAARSNMISQQVSSWGVSEPHVLELLAMISREAFVPEHLVNMAFSDIPLPIGHDQSMLLPHEEGKIIQCLDMQGHESVLEIGTGSGYLTALLAKSAKHVYSVDIFEDFVSQARQRLNALAIDNVELHVGNGCQGWEDNAPYDAIVISGGLSYLPKAFRDQLKIGGRLFAILGEAPVMTAVLMTRLSENEWTEQKLYDTNVPMLLEAPTQTAFVF